MSKAIREFYWSHASIAPTPADVISADLRYYLVEVVPRVLSPEYGVDKTSQIHFVREAIGRRLTIRNWIEVLKLAKYQFGADAEAGTVKMGDAINKLSYDAVVFALVKYMTLNNEHCWRIFCKATETRKAIEYLLYEAPEVAGKILVKQDWVPTRNTAQDGSN